MKSDRFSINWKDFLKGLVLAVVTPILLIIQQSISAGEMTFNWKQIGLTAMAALVAYLIKNFFTDSVSAAQTTLQDARK